MSNSGLSLTVTLTASDLEALVDQVTQAVLERLEDASASAWDQADHILDRDPGRACYEPAGLAHPMRGSRA
jgi:hypothetical protein